MNEAEYQEQILYLMRSCRTCDLTGLGNYRAFYEYVTSLVQLGVRFSVVLFDMTNLKAANTELGHFGADDVLRRVAELIRGGGWDHVFRHGGDEFAVVLPHASVRVGLQVRDRIEVKVGVSYLASGTMLRVVGAAGSWLPTDDLETVLNETDKALERRKVRVKCSGNGRKESKS